MLVVTVLLGAVSYCVPRALPPRISLWDGVPLTAGGQTPGPARAPGIPVGSAGESGSLGLAEHDPEAAQALAPIGGSGGSGLPGGPGLGSQAGQSGTGETGGADEAAESGRRTAPVRFAWPMLGDITSYYGPRDDEFHTGIDIAAVTGQAVRAAMAGTVVEAGWRGGYGLCVVVDHGNGLQTLYAHNSKLEVEIGETVEAGQLLALAGSTGYSTGPHLHFEILLNGFPVNPMPWLEP